MGVRLVTMLVAFALVFGGSPALAADMVVVESRGIDLKPGQTFDGSKPLVLKEGQQVTLISPAGKTIKLRGPTEPQTIGLSLGESGGETSLDIPAALNALMTQKLTRSATIGAVRSGGDEVAPSEPWLLDVTHGGHRCLPENGTVTFWRPTAVPVSARLVLTPSDRSWQAKAEWPAGSDRMVIPKTLPLRNGTTYLVTLGGKEAAITLITIPAAVSNDAMRVGWMMEAGCALQAQALLPRAR